jgi:hypothetical protein
LADCLDDSGFADERQRAARMSLKARLRASSTRYGRA